MKMKPNRIYEFYSKALTSITVRINNTKEKTKYSIIYLLAVLCNIFGGKLNILPPAIIRTREMLNQHGFHLSEEIMDIKTLAKAIQREVKTK